MDHILPRISTSNASGTLLIISWLPVDHEILGFRINVAHKKGRTSKSIRGGGGLLMKSVFVGSYFTYT